MKARTSHENRSKVAVGYKRARELRQQGWSLRVIAGQLAQEGHVPPRGRRWHPASIASLLSIQ